MTSYFTTTKGQSEQLDRIWDQTGLTHEDVKNILAKPELAVKMVTGLHIVSVPIWTPPSWWRTPYQQIDRAHELWPNVDLPKPPANYVPTSKTGVLLLHVPDTAASLWNKVVAPEGYTKLCSENVKFNKRTLRLAPNKHEFTQPVWLEFDPEYGKGQRPDSLWDQPDMAASEVLSALIQFPDWCLSWFNGASAPNLPGFQLKYDGNWQHCPCILRWDDFRQLKLHAGWADVTCGRWACPSVREC
jgi:hypothetical protein